MTLSIINGKIESFPWIATGQVLKAIFILTVPTRIRLHSLNAIHFYHSIIFTDNRQSGEIFSRLKILFGNKKGFSMNFLKRPNMSVLICIYNYF